ncbi:MAG: DNA recombination protein RmuC [Gammaproteobacteria bacterium]
MTEMLLTLTAVTMMMVFTLLLRTWRGNPGAGREVREELRAGREEARGAEQALHEEVTNSLSSASESLAKTLESLDNARGNQLDKMANELKDLTDSNRGALERIRATLDSRVEKLQEGNEKKVDELRKEVSGSLKSVTHALDSRVKELQLSNEKKLDEMRKTVDDKLHDTLEKRLGESFKLVGQQLEAVHKGLGEMQSLATGVGDLKKALTNVKTRGTWGEVQLGAILEQVLTAEQYEKNVCVRADSQERVEYAVRLPGPKNDPGARVWLPIDAKFPQEDYLRLQEVADRGDADAVESA